MKAHTATHVAFSFAPLFRWGGALGKDFVRYVGIGFLIAFVLVVIRLAIAMIASQASFTQFPALSSSATAFFTSVLITALAFGLAASTDEEESQTRQLLDTLPTTRTNIAAQKLLAGMLLLVAITLLTAPVFALLPGGVTTWQLLTESHGQSFILPLKQNLPGVFIGGTALIATGLAMGTIFSNLLLAGAVSILLAGIYFALVTFSIEWDNQSFLQQDGKVYVAAAVWTAAMFALHRRALAAGRERTSGGFAETLDVLRSIAAPRRQLTTFDPSVRHQLNRLTIGLCIAGLFVPMLLAEKLPGPVGSAVYAALAGLLLGLFSWDNIEREQVRSVLFTLPVSRNRFYFARTFSLIVRAVYVGSAVLVGMLIGPLNHMVRDKFDWTNSIHLVPLVLSLPVVLVALVASGALLGSLFRLFSRLRLVAFSFAVTIQICWMAIAAAAFEVIVRTHSPFGAQPFSYLIWAAVVATLLPWLIGWLAYTRSTLLELPESRRGWVTIALVAFLITWGGFFIGMSPLQLFSRFY